MSPFEGISDRDTRFIIMQEKVAWFQDHVLQGRPSASIFSQKRAESNDPVRGKWSAPVLELAYSILCTYSMPSVEQLNIGIFHPDERLVVFFLDEDKSVPGESNLVKVNEKFFRIVRIEHNVSSRRVTLVVRQMTKKEVDSFGISEA